MDNFSLGGEGAQHITSHPLPSARRVFNAPSRQLAGLWCGEDGSVLAGGCARGCVPSSPTVELAVLSTAALKVA